MKARKMAFSVILFIFLVLLVMIAAYRGLNSTVHGIIIQSIDEMAEHDMQSIRVYIANRWDSMDSLCYDIRNMYMDSIEDVQDALNIKVSSGRFDKAYFIDADGRLYSDTYQIIDKKENPFLDYFDDGKSRFVYRYDDETDDDETEYLLYGIDLKANPIKTKDTTFVAMVALNNINKIQEKIKITCFDGKGYSSIINKNGYYIINPNSGSDAEFNFYDMLKSGEISDGISVEAVKDRILNDKECKFYFKDKNNVKNYISIKPVGNSVWFFVNSVEMSVFYANTLRFMVITMAVVAALIIILSLLMYVNFAAQRKIKKLYNSVINGVYNRHYYDERLSGESIKALAIVDLDRLKNINDTYGHLAGDLAIETVGSILYEVMSDIGDVVRYGGDEFAVAVKEDIPAQEFEERLDKVLEKVRAARLESFENVKLTASIGGYYCEGKTADLFKNTDNLLYKAKIDRNAVVTNI